MAVSSRVRNIVLAESLGVCALCSKNIGADGEAAHIVAETPDGPRGKSPLTLLERNSPDNLIYLCVSCHREKIDKYPDKYPVEDLQCIKLRHQKRSEKFTCGEINYFNSLFFKISAQKVSYIFSDACCGIQIQLSESDLNDLTQLQKNIEITTVPAAIDETVTAIRDAVIALRRAFEMEGVEFQSGPYEYKYRVFFYNENDPKTFHRREEYWDLYFSIEALCSKAYQALDQIVKENTLTKFA